MRREVGIIEAGDYPSQVRRDFTKSYVRIVTFTGFHRMLYSAFAILLKPMDVRSPTVREGTLSKLALAYARASDT
jgi:hypothetical protein